MKNQIKISYLADSKQPQEIQNFLHSLVPNVEIISEPINEYFEEEVYTEIKQLLPEELEDTDNKFKQEDWNVREEAALYLAMSRSPKAIPLLLAQINAPQPEVKHMVIYALGRIRGTDAEVREVIATLIEFLADTDFETRLVAVQALGKIASQFATSTSDTQKIIAHLLNRLKTEDDWCVKEAIALAFGMINIEEYSRLNEVIQALEVLQKDDNIFVKRAAAYTLKKIPTPLPETPKQPLVTVLSEWLNGIIDSTWKTLEDFRADLINEQPELILLGNIRSGSEDSNKSSIVQRVKEIYELEQKGKFVALCLTIEPENNQENQVTVEVVPNYSKNKQKYLSPGLKLQVNFESDEPVEIEAKNDDEKLGISFSELSGKQVSVKVSFEDAIFTQDFVV